MDYWRYRGCGGVHVHSETFVTVAWYSPIWNPIHYFATGKRYTSEVADTAGIPLQTQSETVRVMHPIVGWQYAPGMYDSTGITWRWVNADTGQILPPGVSPPSGSTIGDTDLPTTTPVFPIDLAVTQTDSGGRTTGRSIIDFGKRVLDDVLDAKDLKLVPESAVNWTVIILVVAGSLIVLKLAKAI